jgi:glutamyl-tRNA(Gln) amidotransferase subunit E
MPAYGITKEELDQLKRILDKKPRDAIIFVADKPEKAKNALKAVVDRARTSLKCVPEETRSANPDGTTNYMRPRPGAARMYPETDVPPIRFTKEYLDELNSTLPEFPEKLLERLIEKYKLNRKLAKQILDSEYLDLFQTLAVETKVSETIIAVTLTETLKALRRDGVQINTITDDQFRELFKLIDSGKTAKESIPEILIWLTNNENAKAKDALESLGLSMLPRKEVEKLVDKIMDENFEFIDERGKSAFGPIMGIIMKKIRGRVKPEDVKSILKRKLE